MRVLLNTAPSLLEGEMKTGERNDAAIMTTLPYDDIGSEENHKHHLPVDQVQCAKRFCAGTECGGCILNSRAMYVMLLASTLSTPCILKKRDIVLQRMIEKWMQLL